MIRLIIWLVLLLMYAIFDGAGMLKDNTREPAAVRLVRDPVCGVFVVPGKALTSGSGGSTQYFCSEKCRQQWRQR
jgi:YHS domain-containing protein